MTANRIVSVKLGQCRTNSNPEVVLLSDAVRGGIALGVYDPGAGFGGVLYFQFPDSRANLALAARQPALFGDTGLSALLAEALRSGAAKERLILYVLRGSGNEDGSPPDAVKTSYLALRKLLWRTGVLVHRDAVSDHVPASIRLEVGSGCLEIIRHGGVDSLCYAPAEGRAI